MATTIAELNVKITSDMQKIQKDLSSLKTGLDQSSKQAKQSAMNVGGAIKSMAGFLAAAGIAKFGVELVKLAGELDTVKTAFSNLAAGAQGGSQGLLEAVQTATRGTVSELDIMKSSNLALQLMGEGVAEYLPQMAEIATKTARAQGVSASQMLNDIVVASGRQSVMILDNLGISSVTAGMYMEEYAAKLGKTREELSGTEKRAAFFYATMKAGSEITKKSGTDALTFGETLQVIKAGLLDFGGFIAEKITPALRAVGEGMAYIAKQARGLEKELTKGNQEVERYVTANKNTIEKSKFKYDDEWQVKEIDAAGNVVRMWTESAKKINKAKASISAPPTSGGVPGAGAQSPTDWLDDILTKSQEIETQLKKQNEELRTLALSTMSDTISNIGGLWQEYTNNRQSALDYERTREMERISEQYEAEKANIEATIGDKKERDAALKALDEKRARDEKKLNEKIEKEKRKVAHDAAKIQRGIDLAQAVSNTALGISNIWARWGELPMVAGALTAIFGAVNAAQIALIAARPLPPLAEGGYFQGPAIIGEAGREFALPLDGDQGRTAMREMADAILDQIASRADRSPTIDRANTSGAGGGNVYLDGALVGKWISDQSANGGFQIHQRVIVS